MKCLTVHDQIIYHKYVLQTKGNKIQRAFIIYFLTIAFFFSKKPLRRNMIFMECKSENISSSISLDWFYVI